MTEFDRQLYEYLVGLFEDDPLPDEIKFIYFQIKNDRCGYHLEIKGSEIKNTQYFGYHPLEGQYYFFDYPRDKTLFVNELELAIKNLPLFKGRKVFLLDNGLLSEIKI